MCIRDSTIDLHHVFIDTLWIERLACVTLESSRNNILVGTLDAVSYTHLRAHETVLDIVCRLLLEKKKINEGGGVAGVKQRTDSID